MVEIVVVGGGISGLATAYTLHTQAQSQGIPLHCTLIESDNRLGGKIVTEQVDGFTIEGGPDSFITQKPEALALCRELGLGDSLIGINPNVQKTYVLHRGRLTPLPAGIMGGIPTRFLPFIRSSLISPMGKLRMGFDLVIPARDPKDDESVGQFFRRRLGQESVDRLAEPLLAGIHVADAHRLSLQATFPRFSALETKHGSLIKGMLASRRQNPSSQTSAPMPLFMTPTHGLKTMVEALSRQIGEDVRLGQQVTRLETTQNEEHTYRLHLNDHEIVNADTVVLAIPAHHASELVAPFAPILARALLGIRYVSSATLSLAYRRTDIPNALDSTGFLIPQSERRRILACTWSSVKFSHRAPADSVLIRCFLGGSRSEAILSQDDDDLVRIAREELRSIMGIEAAPTFTRLFRWERANPQYDVGHLERVAKIERLAGQIPGLYLTGSPYRGIGIPDCIAQGKATAHRILSHYLEP